MIEGLASLFAFAQRCAKASLGVEVSTQGSLMEAGRVIEREAKSAIGTYKYGWPALTEKTIARKAMGDTPLLETGAMREGIQTEQVDAHTVEVVATDPKSAWHELGTATIPPRPFLGPASEVTKDQQVKEIEKGLMAGLNTGF